MIPRAFASVGAFRAGCGLLGLLVVGCATDGRLGDAAAGSGGVCAHELRSSRQAGPTRVRVLCPDRMPTTGRLPLLLVLPVEPGAEDRYGDGLEEIRRYDLHNRYGVVCVAPEFSGLPWYADHPSDPALQQETYLLDDVIPFVERRYPAGGAAGRRYLLGFSKSGWGAFTLALRHPHTFAGAAAWDAPMMMGRPGPYGSGPVFGTAANFERYRVSALVRSAGAEPPRLVLSGYSAGFRRHHEELHGMMNDAGVPHVYRDGPQRAHHWHSGWVPESVRMLLR